MEKTAPPTGHFADLYATHREALIHYVQKKGVSREEAEDIVHSACEHAYKTQGDNVQHEGYLYRAVDSHFNAFAKAAQRRRRREKKVGEEFCSSGKIFENPELLVRQHELRKRIREVIEQAADAGSGLNIRAVKIYYLNGIESAKNGAEETGATEEAFRVQMCRGRNQLKPLLEGLAA